MTLSPVLLDSITDADDRCAGNIAVSGSHGGLYPAAFASAKRLRAVIFNDAGIGFQRAGIAGVEQLGRVGMAAAAADCMTCLIGSAHDTLENGHLSYANDVADALGLHPGMPVSEAACILAQAPHPEAEMDKPTESRDEVILKGTRVCVHVLDSASLVRPDDAGRIVVTGSHGALVGGDPVRALKADARVAVFSDAGVGKNKIGVSRLPALDVREIAAVTVAHTTARIGDARSILESGIISAANLKARHTGAREGDPLSVWLSTLV